MPLSIMRPVLLAALAIAGSLSDADLLRAIAISKASDAERARFHNGYVAKVREPIVERLEVITEFRRAVLIGEERYLHGDRMYGVKEIRDLLQPYAGRITVHAELKFHPLNAYVRVPGYSIVLGGPGSDEVVGMTAREPIFQVIGSGTSGGKDAPQASVPIVGANLDAQFDAGSVQLQPTLVRIVLDGQIVAAGTFDLSRLE